VEGQDEEFWVGADRRDTELQVDIYCPSIEQARHLSWQS
jgi:hypothetical protein